MNVARLAFFLICVLSANSYGLYCEKLSFKQHDLNSYIPVEGYIVSGIRDAMEMESLYKDYMSINKNFSTISFNEFYRLYLYTYRTVGFFVKENFGGPLEADALISLNKVQFPELAVGEKYILFVKKTKGSEVYDIAPCAFVPLSFSLDRTGYFFKESPMEVRSLLIK